MNLLVHHLSTPKLHLVNQSVAIRTAYMLAKNTMISGDLINGFNIHHLIANMPLSSAAKTMLQDPTITAEERKTVTLYLTIKKNAGKLKHKNTDVLVKEKKMDKLFKDLWLAYSKAIIDACNTAGFSVLYQLVQTEKDIGFMDYNHKNTETPEPKHLPLSETLQLPSAITEETPDHNFIILPAEMTEKLSQRSHPGFDEHDIFFRLCTFKHINQCSTTELMLMRQQLQHTTVPVSNMLNEWAALLEKKSDEGWLTFWKKLTKPLADNEWFKTNIAPAAAALQHAIDHNPTQAAVMQKKDIKMDVHVHVGSAYLRDIWKLMEEFDQIPEATRKALETAEAKAAGAIRKPYVCLVYEMDTPVPPSGKEAAPTAAPVKKSISFD